MTDIAAIVREFLLDHFRIEPGELSDSTPLFSTGLLDSFAMVELVAFAESSFKKKVRARDLTLENFDSIERIVGYFSAAP
jgi:acyl carrier protein